MSSHLGLGFKALPYGALPSPILNLLKSLLLCPTKWIYYMVSRACQHPPQHSLLFIPAPLSLLLCIPAWSDLLFPWPVPAGLRIYYLGQFYKSFTVNFSHVHLLPLQLGYQTSKPCLIYHHMPTTSCTVPNASEISISISRFILKTDKLTLCSHLCLYQVDLEQTKRNLAAFFPSDCTWSLALQKICAVSLVERVHYIPSIMIEPCR